MDSPRSSTPSSILTRLIPGKKDSHTSDSSAETPDGEAGPSSKVVSSCEMFTLFKVLAGPSRSRSKSRSKRKSTTDTPPVSPSRKPELNEKVPITSSPDESPSLSSPGSPALKPETIEPGWTDEQKIKAIQDEFGDIASTLQDENGNVVPERMLSEGSGSLFKGIMMIGNLHLTTHRLLFHALLPPDEAFVRHYDSAEEFESLGTSPVSQAIVLHSGPVTWHRHGPLAPTQRLWMELTSEMLTTYPSANEDGRVRPIKSILLSSIHSLRPLDEANPADFHITYEDDGRAHHAFFTVDTSQSAVQWRRDINAGLFRLLRLKWRHNAATRLGRNLETSENEWNTLRYCVPLNRVTLSDLGEYHGVATLMGLKVSLDAPQRLLFHSELAGQGDFFGASQIATLDHLKHLSLEAKELLKEDPLTFSFNIAALNDANSFPQALQHATETAHQWTLRPGAKEHRMTFNVAGLDCFATDEDAEQTETPEREEHVSLPARIARKAERGHLAARAFGLHEEEGIWLKRCYVQIGGVPVRGHLILTPRYVCFWRRNTITPDVKYRFPRDIVKGFELVSCSQPGFSGLALKLHGQHDVIFEFWKQEGRSEVMERIEQMMKSENIQPSTPSTPTGPPTPSHPSDILVPNKKALFETRTLPDDFLSHMPFIANKPWLSRSVALSPRTFALLTIGSRGDVQPYIALGLRLKRDGHRVVIVTHNEFKEWVEGYELEHRQAGGDPTALMRLSQEHKMLSPGFFKESVGFFRQWLDDLLVDAWEACKNADVLIESPSAMAGIHIAERLRIPYFRAFTMPWTRTTSYPQAFMVPAFEMGPSFNYSTYVMYDNIIWKATSGQINRWRKRYLELENTDMSAMSATKVPFLYNFSSAVVPKPLDWHDDIAITGYWILENSDSEWSPPEDLERFMEQAKTDGKPLVYIGFGSIVVPKPNTVTRTIIEGVEKADVRAIIAKGWSSRSGDPASEGKDIEFPSSCYSLEKVPHGWLFPRVQAAFHHGGAGTVGASLRAGLPTIIKPWFGDQYFWANRVTKLGVGLRVSSLNANDVSEALVKATSDRVMIEKATRIGEAIRQESGVDNAVEAIHYNILRAGSDRTKMSWAK